VLSKPVGIMLELRDNHGRPLNYLRLAIIDRCNLRCFYCMPEEGIKYMQREELLSYEEMERLITVMAGMGVDKVRITGGEPFLRKDLMTFLKTIRNIKGIEQINITTNGVYTKEYIDELKALDITNINLSLDTLDKEKFFKMTRRDAFDEVMSTFHALLAEGFNVKINAVAVSEQSEEDIYQLGMLSRDYPVSVRFIEEMPFNGQSNELQTIQWTYKNIHKLFHDRVPGLSLLKAKPSSTSTEYSADGHKGTIGIIPAYSRTFCGQCNRIRITARGMLKTCLYDEGVLDIKHMLRAGISETNLKKALMGAFNSRAKDGFEAESRNAKDKGGASESMSMIGG